MKRKIGLTATPMPKNWVRALYIISKRKLRRIDHDLLIAVAAVIILILQMFIIVTAVNGQEKPKGLQIGDKVPDVVITNIINHPTGTAKISDFRGKLLILDFWSTYCSSCFPALYKLEGMAKKYEGRLAVLPVTGQSRDLAASVWRRRDYSLPTVTEDTQLAKWFPHRYLPHVVWIMDGTLKAITSSKEVTETNIETMLKTQNVSLLTKADLVLDTEKPLFVNGNGGEGKALQYHSVIAGYTPGLPHVESRRRSAGKVYKLCYTNSPVLRLYQVAFQDANPFFEFRNRIVLEVPDTLKQVIEPTSTPFGESLSTGYRFSIDLQVPQGFSGNIYKMMQSDLNRFFSGYYGFEGHLETRSTRVLALVPSGPGKYETVGGNPERKVSGNAFMMKNLPLYNFLRHLAWHHKMLSTPIIDATGFTGNADLEINADLTDLKAVNRELMRYGLQLKEQQRDIEMLVFKPVRP